MRSHCDLDALSLRSRCDLAAISMRTRCALAAISRRSHCDLTAISLRSHCDLAAISREQMLPSIKRSEGTHVAQPVLVRAGPGTGKTWMIKQALFLLAEQVIASDCF